MGNYGQLRRLAYQIVREDPRARTLIDSFNLRSVYAYYEEPTGDYSEPEPGNCLVALLVPFVEPLPEGADWGENLWMGHSLMREALSLVGWARDDIDLFMFGKSLCEMFNPSHISELQQRRWARGKIGDPWCASEPGWLDTSTIERLIHRLIDSKDDLVNLARKPERFTSWLVDQPFLEKGLSDGYGHMEKVLMSAKLESRELIVQIVS